jgi:hypothetical protein
MNVGYYIFFGYGDYHPSSINSKIWVNSWTIDVWKNFINHLVEIGINTLMIYLNGHFLPYQSHIYPELIDTEHPNCQKEFLIELMKYIKKLGIEIIIVITTTGHAGKYASLHPDACIEIANTDSSVESTLVSFPDHLKKNKLKMQEGKAQLGHGVLCHNKRSAQVYAVNIISEIVTIYGEYLDGIALHPPESAYPCSCMICHDTFKIATGLNIFSADQKLVREFFIKSYLKFQNENLFPLIKSNNQKCKLFTFTIPWFFEQSFESIIPHIPKEIVIIDWDYNIDAARIDGLSDRLNVYRSYGHSVWFMPSAGFSFDKNSSLRDQIESVIHQIEIAVNTGVDGVIHFLGPKSSEFIDETSFKTFLTQNQRASSFRI